MWFTIKNGLAYRKKCYYFSYFFTLFQETCSASTMSALASLAIEAQNVPIEKTALMENASEVKEATTTRKLATTTMSVQPTTKHIYVLREGTK
jgi:hypothetical protein